MGSFRHGATLVIEGFNDGWTVQSVKVYVAGKALLDPDIEWRIAGQTKFIQIAAEKSGARKISGIRINLNGISVEIFDISTFDNSPEKALRFRISKDGGSLDQPSEITFENVRIRVLRSSKYLLIEVF